MNGNAIRWALKQDVGFAWGKAVLLALATYVDKEGKCWPSQQKLATDLEVTDRTVRTKLAELEKAGLIYREKRSHLGMRSVDLITLNISGAEFGSGERKTSAEPHAPPPELYVVPPESDDTTTGISTQKPPERRSRELPIELPNEQVDMDLVFDLERQAFNAFVDVAKAHRLTVPQMLNPTRRAHIRQRLLDCGGLDGWRAAMDKLAASPYLTGKVKDWKADLDFVLNPTRFAKLMEGGYDGRTDPPKLNGTCRQAARREAIERSSRELAAEFS